MNPPLHGDHISDEGQVGRALRPVRLLVIAAFAVPIVVFLAASITSYSNHKQEATARLQSTLQTVYEHARKVFETFEVASLYTDNLTDEGDDIIRVNEEMYHHRLASLVQTLPQILDIWVVDVTGHPVVSGLMFPLPKVLNLSARPYFQELKNNPARDTYVSEILSTLILDLRFFSFARARSPVGGQFSGVISISAKPEYFSSFYSTLPKDDVESIAILRVDGNILARYPATTNGSMSHFGEDDAMMHAIRTSPSGLIEALSPLDGATRIFAFRRLAGLNVVVLVGMETTTIWRRWLGSISRNLIVGLPAAASLIALSLMALSRTRREVIVHKSLRREVARREQTEQALRQSQKMEAVGRLTGGIAHDFNNLLTAILGNVDLALKFLHDTESKAGQLLLSARHASERAATLVQRLLAFSRQHPLEVKAVDVNRLVHGMSDLLRRAIGESIEVKTVLAGELWKVAVDPNQLENAIVNLAVNARDAMPNGGHLTIETANSHLDEFYIARNATDIPPGQYVLVAVSDSGNGMSREVVERAFEPFFTTKGPGVGSGLGLSMVYGFVKQSGGHIKIYSEPNEGTSIKLYFPKLDDRNHVDDWEMDSLPAAYPSEQERRSGKILIVEDDADVNRFATEVLAGQGYGVLSASDGLSALKLLDAASDVDLLFTDVVLPGGMNGKELAVAATRRKPGLKVLYATGYTRDAIVHQGRLEPDLELLTKPFTQGALLRKIQQVMEAKPRES